MNWKKKFLLIYENNMSLKELLISDELNSLSNITSASISMKQLTISLEALEISKKILKSTSATENLRLLSDILEMQKQILEELKKINKGN